MSHKLPYDLKNAAPLQNILIVVQTCLMIITIISLALVFGFAISYILGLP